MFQIRLNFIAALFSSRLFSAFLACLFASIFTQTISANAQTRTLKLYYLHTGEKTKVTYYKNGRYLSSGLKKANWALRDWRRNEPTKIDPKLLDLVYEAYRRSGSKAWIHVISGYRSPATNNALRRTRGGQAKNSQHTHGKALDFFLPDVKIKKLREIGLKMGIGGVGYYPKSGSPFVHLDTGNVRHWPRMSRKQLVRMFPKGDTMHVPTDGKRLARYKTAVAAYKKRKASGKIVKTSTKKELNFFQRLAARTKDDENEGSQNSVAVPRAVKTIVKTPKRKPKEPAPAPPTAEALLAALPRNKVPVPIAAPRSNSLNTGENIQVAALPPEPKVEEPIAPVVEAVVEPVVEPVEPEAPSQQLAIIPVPVKRPNYEAVIVTAALDPEIVKPEPIVEPIKQEAPSQQITGLSPTEIQDLRKSAKIDAPVVDTVIAALPTPSLPAPTQPIPRPAQNVGETVKLAPNGLPLAKTFPVGERPPIVEPIAKPVVEPIKEPEIVVAKLEPIEKPIATPVEKPIDVPIAKTEPIQEEVPKIIPQTAPTRETELALAIIDDKPSAGEQAAINAIDNVTDNTTDSATTDPLQPVETQPELATTVPLQVPVPTPSPKQPAPEDNQIVIAALEPEKVEPTAEPVIEPVVEAILEPIVEPIVEPVAEPTEEDVQVASLEPELRGRTVSLDQFSAPQENTSRIGQYALAPDITIHGLNNVQAPAYGRNMIRSIPNTIFTDGFRTDLLPGTQKGFSGKAIVFAKFEKLN